MLDAGFRASASSDWFLGRPTYKETQDSGEAR